MWLTHDVKKNTHICQKSLSRDSSLGRTHVSCLLPRRQSTVFSGFIERRRQQAVWLNNSGMPCFLLSASCFSWVLPAPFAPARGMSSIQNCMSLLSLLSKSWFRVTCLLFSCSSVQNNSWLVFARNTCKVHILVFLLVSTDLCGILSNCLEVTIMLHPKVWKKCLVVLPFFQTLL